MILTNEIIKIAYELYNQGNTLSETTRLIDKRYNLELSHSTIGRRFRKNGLKLRNYKESLIRSKRKHIDIPQLLKEYPKINSIRELSRKFGIARGTIKKILKENRVIIPNSRTALIRMGNINEKEKFILSLQEKAYLYGLVMGDLTPVRKSNYTLKLITHSTHKTFMSLLVKSFEKYGITNYKETKNLGMFRFQTHIDLESFSFLLDSKKQIIPEWIQQGEFFSFLAGFIDSDGSIMVKKSGNNFQFAIRFFGENLLLLLEIKKKLETLGYNPSIHKNHCKGDSSYHCGKIIRYNKDYYAVEIQRKDQTLSLLNKIPIRHPEKIAKIQLMQYIKQKNFTKWYEVENQVKLLKSKIKQSVLQKTILENLN